MELEEFIRQQNLELHRKLPAVLPADDSRRMMLMKILAQEEATETAKGRVCRSQ